MLKGKGNLPSRSTVGDVWLFARQVSCRRGLSSAHTQYGILVRRPGKSLPTCFDSFHHRRGEGHGAVLKD